MEKHQFEINQLDVSSFVRRLEAFAGTLTDEELRSLKVVLYSAMDPIERIRLIKSDQLLSHAEQLTVEGLMNRREHS